MIHTAEFYVELEEEELINIGRKYNKKLYKRITGLQLGLKAVDGISCVFKKGYALYKGVVWRAHIYVNFQALLMKPQVVPEDIEKIDFKIVEYVRNFASGNIILSRLDFKYDAVIIDTNTKKILLKLYKKCINKRYFMIKSTKFKNSVRFNSKSRSSSIYDKECERIDKNEEIKDYEKGVLRFEAQVKGTHFYYKYKEYGIARAIKEYFNYEFYKKYMNDMIVKIIGKGDYYNVYYAKKLINESKLTKKDKEEIIKFMKKVSKAGMTEAKKTITEYYYKKYLKALQMLDINPILIPKSLKITYIPNPLKDLYS